MPSSRKIIFRFGTLAALTFLSNHAYSEEFREFIDDAKRNVRVPSTISRVFAAGPPAAILLYTLAPDTLLGWNRALEPEEAEFIAPPYRDLPVVGRLTGRASTTHVEDVLRAGAQVILDYGNVTETYRSLADRAQQKTNIPYILIDGAYKRIPDAYRRLGELLNRHDRAEHLAQYAETLQQRTDHFVSAIPPSERPRVYYGRGPDGLETGGTNSINAELLTLVGAINVVQQPGSAGLVRVSMEDILRWNPDVVITLDERFFDSALTNRAWQTVSAVIKNNVFLAPRLPFGWFDRPPSVNRLIGVPWLLSILYPKSASHAIEPEVSRFYSDFYHINLSRLQLQSLLVTSRAR